MRIQRIINKNTKFYELYAVVRASNLDINLNIYTSFNKVKLK